MTISGTTSTTDAHPFFRYDLVSKAIQEGDHRFVDVTDPNTGKTFRFYEVEYAVACGMDGSRDLDALASWAKEELGLDTSPDELRRVVSTLDDLGYLTAEETAAALAAAEPEPLPATPEPVAPKPVAPKPVAPVAAVPAPAPAVPAPAPAAPAPIAAAAGEDVALGNAGRSPMQRQPRPQPPAPADIELGLAGAPEKAPSAEPVSASHEEVELGLAGATSELSPESPSIPDQVSRDLSQQFKIGVEDVKEAVRQSQVMTAVELPDDLKEVVSKEFSDEDDMAAPAKVAPPPPPPPPPTPALTEKAAGTGDKAEAIVLPDEPAVARVGAAAEQPDVDKDTITATVPSPSKKSSVGLLVAILIIVAGAAAGWYYYSNYVKGKDKPKKAELPVQPVAPPQPPPPPSATLAAGETPSVEVVAERNGSIAYLTLAGSEVAEGEAVAKLSGFERYQRSLERNEKSKAGYEAEREAATSDRAREFAQKNVERKEGDIAKDLANLDPYILEAPMAGVAEPLVEERARVSEGDPVVKISGDPKLTAAFTVPSDAGFRAGQEVTIAVADDGEVKATCVVLSVEGDNVAVECSSGADSGLAVGAKVILVL